MMEAKAKIQEGDILLFSGVSCISHIIRKATGSEYSHIGIASWVDGTLEILEFREWKGGRAVNFTNVLTENSGKIDVYRPNDTFEVKTYSIKEKKVITELRPFNPHKVTKTFRGLTGLPYGYYRIFYLLKFYTLGSRLIYANNKSASLDNISNNVFPVCSTAVAHAFNINGYDLIKNRSDERTVPGDIAMSPLLSYLFTPVIENE